MSEIVSRGETRRQRVSPGSSLTFRLVPVIILVALWLWLAFWAGGYLPRHWGPPVMAVAVIALLVGAMVAYPRRPGQLSLLLLGFFTAYWLWASISATWALSETLAWVEAVRTLGYLMFLALALTYFTDHAARRYFRYLVILAVTVLCAAAIWKLWADGDLLNLFAGRRFTFPTGHPDHAAALYLVAFWPLMWLASSQEERAPVRGICLGLATCVLGLALLTQSRGAAWSLSVSLVFMFAVSPARLRLFFYLLVPSLLMVYQFPQLNRYWKEDPVAVGGAVGARTLLVAALAAAFIGMILALLEGWIRVKRRLKPIVGLLIILGCVVGLVYGGLVLSREAGGLPAWFSRAWCLFTTDAEPQTVEGIDPGSDTRLADLSSPSRVSVWKVAWLQFKETPVGGVGAENFALAYDRLRTTGALEAEHAHSLTLQILADTGVVGGVFAFGGMLVTTLGLLWPRIAAGWAGARSTWLGRKQSAPPERSGGTDETDLGTTNTGVQTNKSRWGKDPTLYGWHMAVLGSAVYWLVHAQAEWLWQMMGVGLPGLLLLAAAVADIDARSGRLWPRSSEPQPHPHQPGMGPAQELRTVAAGGTGGQEMTPFFAEERGPDPETPLFLLPRRAEKYEKRLSKRSRKMLRKNQRQPASLSPPGAISRLYRLFLLVLSILLLLGAGTLYVSRGLADSAVALSVTDPKNALVRAHLARWFAWGDPRPFLAEAWVCREAAVASLFSSRKDRAGAVLDNLALALRATRRAAAAEAADWTTHYEAAWAATDLLLARGYVEEGPQAWAAVTLPPHLADDHDWSALAEARQGLAAPGEALDSLAKDNASIAGAAQYRSLGKLELKEMALQSVRQAVARNPLEPRVDHLRQFLESLPL